MPREASTGSGRHWRKRWGVRGTVTKSGTAVAASSDDLFQAPWDSPTSSGPLNNWVVEIISDVYQKA
ncbi:MAG: hypothetical protein FRX49_02262 [Trebouxia sp. A1-2]|nr:MAG: hypothetical protein FRX49_02262 [Trebouxia sp. A1-2]